MSRTAYEAEISTSATKHGLPAALVEAQVVIESAGHTDAFRYEAAFWAKYLAGKQEWASSVPRRVSSSYGLLQIMYVTAKEIGFTGEPEMLFVPAIGLDWGCRKLSELMAWAQRAGPTTSRDVQIRSALAAYNGGRVRNEPDITPDRNAAYADKVLRLVVGRL